MERRSDAYHEAGHAYAAEFTGWKVTRATVVPDQDRERQSEGMVSYAVPGSAKPIERLTVDFAGHAAMRFFDPDAEPIGHDRDFEYAADICQDDADLRAEGLNRAYRLVRDPLAKLTIERLAAELMAKGERGLGMNSLDVGRVIAEAADDYAGSRVLYGQRPRPRRLAECTPSEQIYRRAALLTEIDASTTVRKPRAKRSKPGSLIMDASRQGRRKAEQQMRKAATAAAETQPGFGSPGGWTATQSFEAVIDGQREKVIADVTSCRDGHELVRKYPSRFRPREIHPLDAAGRGMGGQWRAFV